MEKFVKERQTPHYILGCSLAWSQMEKNSIPWRIVDLRVFHNAEKKVEKVITE